MTGTTKTYDFIIVGSGAGGGPLAANLAEAGFRVLLLEAGTDHQCPYYDVPIMQARASEDGEMRWDFFVRHYSSDEQQRRDSKFVASQDGVLYPRGATLGGSTAISALVTVYPHNSDWDGIAEITGDPDWNAEAMRRRFERIEQWQGPDVDRSKPAVPGDGYRHGFEGWLKVRRADPKLAGREAWFLDIINAIEETSRKRFGTPSEVPLPNDPNDWRVVSERREGMAFIPVAVGDGERNGARERVLTAQRTHPDRLSIQYKALVTRVLFEDDRAVGVEYLGGEHLYDADPNVAHAHEPPSVRQVFAAIAGRLSGIVKEELVPGGAASTREALRTFVRAEAWGHHASCTCKIGADDDPMAVLDGDFRVRGVKGLRVVDASVFPRIPGFFIASAVYMVSERASDVIIREHGAG